MATGHGYDVSYDLKCGQIRQIKMGPAYIQIKVGQELDMIFCGVLL